MTASPHEDICENSPDGAEGSSKNALNKKLLTRRQALTTGTLAALTALVSVESANEQKISAVISELTNKLCTMLGFRSKYDVNKGEDLPSILKKNIPLSEHLSCDITVDFISTGKDEEGKDDHTSSIKVIVHGLPPNPNGSNNNIVFVLKPRYKITPDKAMEYFLRTETIANFDIVSGSDHIEYIKNELGSDDSENNNSPPDPAAVLEEFRTPNLEPYQRIETMTDEEVAALARSITELSLSELEARPLASALTENSQE